MGKAVSTSAPPKLQLRGVTKTYGSVHAVDRVDLDVHEGEFFTILGPSGSGKTTLLMMVAGLVLPTSGQILLNGVDATYVPPHRRDIGMVFQNYALFPHMTVRENIAFPLRMRRRSEREIERRVAEVLELVRLPGYGDRYPSQLSGGQRQRVAMARALVYEPSILLMDEPMGALDKKLRDEMQLEIKALHEKLKITVLYVTHDQGEALTMSDRICVMNEGRIVQVGTPEELYRRPANRFVAQFLGESNVLSGTLRAGSEYPLLEFSDGTRVPVSNDSGLGDGEKVCVIIRPEDIQFVDGEQHHSCVLEGRIERVVFLGDTVRYWVRTFNGTSFMLKQLSGLQSRVRRPGEPVRVGWRPESTRVYHDD